jgi:CRP/FNR family transcriptional regulator
VPYFAEIAQPHLDTLAQQAVAHTFSPGEIIFMEGDSPAGLWILESGRVKIYKLGLNGREYILRFLGPGDTFNDLAALDGAPNPISAMAITDISAWVISADSFTEALHADHQLAEAVVGGLVGRIRHLIGQVEDLALHSVTARLARFLLEQVDDPTLSHPAVTRSLIANHLATTPESISRSLRELEQAGAIRFDRHRIFISQPDTLRHIAQSP